MDKEDYFVCPFVGKVNKNIIFLHVQMGFLNDKMLRIDSQLLIFCDSRVRKNIDKFFHKYLPWYLVTMSGYIDGINIEKQWILATWKRGPYDGY